MAVIYRHRRQGERLEAELQQAGIPVALQSAPSWDAGSGSVKLLTMHSSKGLEYPIVLVAGVCQMEPDPTASKLEAKLLYVAMTRSMRHLEMTHHMETPLTKKIYAAISELA
jgi:superfamily I DNA/RNA helicase